MQSKQEQNSRTRGDWLKILARLSYLGNALLILAMLVAMFWMMLFPESVLDDSNTEKMGFGILLFGCVLVIAMSLLCIFGVYQLTKGRNGGFLIFAGGNVLWILVNLVSGQVINILIGTISILIIIGFSFLLKSQN